MSLILITAPSRYPVTLEETRAHLRVETDDDDAYLDSLIEMATSCLDGPSGLLGRCLVQQTWELQLPYWPCEMSGWGFGPQHIYMRPIPNGPTGQIEIPLAPLVSVTSVKYMDGAGDEQTLDEDQYITVPRGWEPGIVQPIYGGTWPTSSYSRPDAIRVRFVAGYASVVNGGLSGTIPRNIIQCMLKAIGSAYENRDQAVDMYVDQTLLAPSRLPVVA